MLKGTRMKEKILTLIFASTLASVCGHTQQLPGAARFPDPPAQPRIFIASSDVNGRIVDAAAAAKAGARYQGNPILATGPFRGNLEYHATPTADSGVNELDAELFVVLEGSGTLMLGGTLVNPKRSDHHLSAARAEGAVPYKLAKGDMVMVPANTAHSFSEVTSPMTLLSVHLLMPEGAPPTATLVPPQPH
jgi:hypothetical protein